MTDDEKEHVRFWHPIFPCACFHFQLCFIFLSSFPKHQTWNKYVIVGRLFGKVVKIRPRLQTWLFHGRPGSSSIKSTEHCKNISFPFLFWNKTLRYPTITCSRTKKTTAISSHFYFIFSFSCFFVIAAHPVDVMHCIRPLRLYNNNKGLQRRTKEFPS